MCEHPLEVAAQRSGVLPVLRHLGVVIDDRKALRQAQMEIVIFGEAKPLVEGADRDEGVAPVDGGRHHDPAAEPSSTTTISTAEYVCASADAMASPRKCAWL